MFDPTIIIVAALGSLPGLAALFNARNQKKDTDERVDSAAFAAAEKFYKGTLDNYRDELAIVREESKAKGLLIAQYRAELDQAKTDREFLSMRITMLEREKGELEKRILELEAKTLAPPTEEE